MRRQFLSQQSHFFWVGYSFCNWIATGDAANQVLGAQVKLYLSIRLRHLWLRSTHENQRPSVLLLSPWLFVILSELLGTSCPMSSFSSQADALHRSQSARPLLLFLPHLLRISLALLSRAFCWHFEILYLRSWREKKNWSLKHGTVRFYGWDKSVCIFIDLTTLLWKAQL